MKKHMISLLVISALAVGGSPSTVSASPLPAASQGDAIVDRALARVDRLREGLSGGTLAGAVRAAADLGGIAVQEEAPPAVDAPAGIPSAIAVPVGTLVAAVTESERSAQEAIRADLPSLARAARQVLRLLPLAGTGDRRVDQRLEELRAFAERSVDRPALYSGAAALAGAIDRALPALRAYGETLAPGPAVVGCDQVDLPNLCIGGTGDNTYTSDKALLIDLGGNDTHANSAGGASPLGNGLPVSVTIDLSGNDTYASPLPSPSGSIAVQGSGYTGGIGVLVDAAGDDAYAAATNAPAGFVMAQGVGISGVGILADMRGSDSYRVTHSSPGDPETDAQGEGVLGGLGLVLDEGQGDDDYLVEARPPLLVSDEGISTPAANAFGYGVAAAAGVGVWADDGGNDSVTLAVEAPTVSPDDPRTLVVPGGFFAGYFAGGLGYAGTGAAAAAIEGTGDTTYNISARASAPQVGSGSAAGMGYGSVGSFAAMHDEGGNDAYIADATFSALSRAAVDDSCGCSGVEAISTSQLARTQVGGLGVQSGVGLLQDMSGNDRYFSTATSTAEAEATDDHEEPPPPPEGEEAVSGAVARAIAGPATSWAFGVSIYTANLAPGAGLLVDHGGDDLYDSRTTSDARATAHALDPLTPTEGIATSDAATSYSRAAVSASWHGRLNDYGGNDTYTSTNLSHAAADPETDVTIGKGFSFVQGSGDGITALLIDSSPAPDTDTFIAIPANPACTGTRGMGVWVDCTGYAGGGVNV